MLFKPTGADRIPPGILKQLASVQQTVTQSGVASNTPVWYDGADLNSTTAAMDVGSEWDDSFTGNSYRYVKAQSGTTISLGMAVTGGSPTSGTVTAAGSTVQVVITNITTTVNEAGNYIWFLDAVGVYSAAATPYKQSLRLIKSSTVGANAVFTVSQRGSIYGNNAYDPDALPSVPTNGSACRIIRPFNVELATAAKAPVGIALSEVTAGNYTIIQTKGLALVAADGTAATVVGTPALMSGTAGVITGGASSALTGAGNILPMYAHSSATVSLIPCYVNFKGA